MIKKTKYITFLFCFIVLACKNNTTTKNIDVSFNNLSKNILNFQISPKNSIDKSGLMFSDQGAWFAYSIPDTSMNYNGFSGPFLMTQQNGIWSSSCLSKLALFTNNRETNLINAKDKYIKKNSFASHLEQSLINKEITLKQELIFLSGHTALQRTTITNTTKNTIQLQAVIQGDINNVGIKLSKKNNTIKLISEKSSATGWIQTKSKIDTINITNNKKSYTIFLKEDKLAPNQSKEIIVSQTFIFPEYSFKKEQNLISKTNFDSILVIRKKEKNKQLKQLVKNLKPQFQDSIYGKVIAKSLITLQNNWRIPAGEIKYEGLFPSYHYKWFNGFWAWDSWKHAAGLSYYDISLAKNQLRAMFNFQKEDGFIVDCIFRDTTIEAHNYRNTKPPLATWAVEKIYKKDKDTLFVKELYPKLKKYHYWWYLKRDHDKDGICEYGSTDGSLIAAKWESGMDNAIRFDNSKILKNEKGAYSLNQESVDLNAYLYAEKLFLITLAEALQKDNDIVQLKKEAAILKLKIQQQFYDKKNGWFYDTSIDGKTFIKGEGSEGWIPLWANVATQKQAESVKNTMLNAKKFYCKIPFQTMSSNHKKFAPLEGYWRGPNWLDQAYFGVKALRNYGFNSEADKATIKILKGANGLLDKGTSIRENYHPLTGKGLHAQNFSWSAAHIIMLLMKDK